MAEKIVRKKRKELKKLEPKSYAAKAVLRGVRISPQKARIIVNMIRGKHVEEALKQLQYSPTKGAEVVTKLLKSAVANASEQGKADVDELWVTGARVDMGKTLKRFIPRAQGRATPIRKRSSQITLELGEK